MHRTTNMGEIYSFYELELEVEKAVDKHFLYKEIEHCYIQYILLKLPGFLKHCLQKSIMASKTHPIHSHAIERVF